MLTRIDHMMICVADLELACDTYTRIGFNVHPGGIHAGKGTHNAIAFNAGDYLELLAIRDAAEYGAASPAGELPGFIKDGGGLRYIVVQSDDLAADVAAMRARGVDVSDPTDGARRTTAGVVLEWRTATLGARNALPVFFIQHRTPLEVRRAAAPGAGAHPNGVTHAERAYIVVTDVAAAAPVYSQVLGMPTPPLERGTVINADMAVFKLGPGAITLAQPAGAGVAADALARRGPGPFQVLYRTTGMEAAARWIAAHGVSPPERGIRNTGEQAMLVAPEHACGVYIGFVGPA